MSKTSFDLTPEEVATRAEKLWHEIYKYCLGLGVPEQEARSSANNARAAYKETYR